MRPRRFLACAALTALTVLGITWVYVCERPLWFLERTYPLWLAKQTMLRDCDFGQVLILGDSRPDAAIMPTLFDISAANIAFGGTSPAETWFFARRAMACPNRPKLVIYSHSLSSFTAVSPFLWSNDVRYGFISLTDLLDMRAVAGRLHDPVLSRAETGDGLTGFVRDVVYGLHFPSIYAASLLDARIAGRADRNRALLDATLKQLGYTVYTPVPGQGPVGIDAGIVRFAPSAMEQSYFERTMALFADAGIPVAFLTIPDSDSTVEAMTPGVTEAFAAFLAHEPEDHTGFFLASSLQVRWPDRFFVDGMHLTQAGATVFSQRLAACLPGWLAGGRVPCPLPPP